MINRKKGFMPMLLLSLLLFLAAFITLIPFDKAGEVSLLGYKALNSLSPISTAILLTGSIVAHILRKKLFISQS